MSRRILFVGLFLMGLLVVTSNRSQAVGVCDNSDPCISRCVIVDSEGNIRIYPINRCA